MSEACERRLKQLLSGANSKARLCEEIAPIISDQKPDSTRVQLRARDKLPCNPLRKNVCSVPPTCG